MRLNSFLKLVEIQTKVASMIPFLLGTVYVLYHYGSFNLINFLLFFCSLILIDMTTTALNNYFDWKRANKRHGYNFEIHNSIEKYRLKERTVIAVILVMLLSAIAIGIILVLKTNLAVLAIGAFSFFIGICYSFGPLPISRTPLGEIFSGFFMGFVILFLAVYIHVSDKNVLAYNLSWSEILIHIGIPDVISIFLVSIPALFAIANIMLANNICDVEDDIANNRFTLPVYIGKKKAIFLFNALYYAIYLDIIIMAVAGILHILCLLTLITLLPVYKGLKLFNAVQSKKETFSVAVKNFLIIGSAMIVTIFVSWII